MKHDLYAPVAAALMRFGLAVPVARKLADRDYSVIAKTPKTVTLVVAPAGDEHVSGLTLATDPAAWRAGLGAGAFDALIAIDVSALAAAHVAALAR